MTTVESGFNMDSIKGWMESNRITEVECLFPDFTGNARGKIIPANKFLREGGHAAARGHLHPDGDRRIPG